MDELTNVTVGDPRDESNVIGPLIRAESVDAMIDSIDEALKMGGKLLTGGERLGPTYIKPALVELDKERLNQYLPLVNFYR